MKKENYRFEIEKEFSSDDDMALPQKVFETNDEKEAIGFYLSIRDKDISDDYYYQITDKTKLDGYYHGDNIEWRKEINELSQEKKDEYIEYYSTKHNEHEKQEKQALENEVTQQQPTEKEKANEVENEVKQQKDFSLAIKISPTDDMDKDIKKLFEEQKVFGRIYQNEEADGLFRTLAEIDKVVQTKSFEKNEFPTSKIKFELQSSSGDNIEILAPLGKRQFEEFNMRKLVDFSSKDLNRNQVSDELQNHTSDIGKKDINGHYEKKIDNHTMERIFDGGLSGAVKTAESIGDEHLEAFVKGFAQAYGFNTISPTEKEVFVEDKEQDKGKENEQKSEKSSEKTAETTTDKSDDKSNEKSEKTADNTQDKTQKSQDNEISVASVMEEQSRVASKFKKGKGKKEREISKPTDKSI